MKTKYAAMLLIVVLMTMILPNTAFALTSGSPGLSDMKVTQGDRYSAKEYTFGFTKEEHLGYKDSWPVYSAPSLNAVRGANGKASLHTSESVRTGGWSGAWLMVRYEKGNGGYRVGWVPKSVIKSGSVDATRNVNFAYWTVELNQSCNLTDDPLYESETLAYASAGEKLTYLAYYNYNDGREYAYVQGELDGKPVCGFIPFEAIKW